jgi:glycerol-3-phosphate responsive antiterminator
MTRVKTFKKLEEPIMKRACGRIKELDHKLRTAYQCIEILNTHIKELNEKNKELKEK